MNHKLSSFILRAIKKALKEGKSLTSEYQSSTPAPSMSLMVDEEVKEGGEEAKKKKKKKKSSLSSSPREKKEKKSKKKKKKSRRDGEGEDVDCRNGEEGVEEEDGEEHVEDGEELTVDDIVGMAIDRVQALLSSPPLTSAAEADPSSLVSSILSIQSAEGLSIPSRFLLALGGWLTGDALRDVRVEKAEGTLLALLEEMTGGSGGGTSLRGERYLISACEWWCGVYRPEMTKFFSVLLKQLYDEDILSEEACLDYKEDCLLNVYAQGMDVEVSGEILGQLRDATGMFFGYLEEEGGSDEEEEGEEEEEDGESEEEESEDEDGDEESESGEDEETKAIGELAPISSSFFGGYNDEEEDDFALNNFRVEDLP